MYKMIGEAEVLRRLVEECLDDDPAVRPTIATVCERIQVSKNVYMKDCPKECITVLQQVQQLKAEIFLLRNETEQQRTTIEQMSSTRSTPTQQVASQLNRVTLGEGSRSKLRTEAPPLMPALTSGRYYIKCTRLADLPVPLFYEYVAVQHHKIYVAGGVSPVEDAIHQVYVYDINTDQWGQLPPSGHYYGIPHIIGGKLVIIGGCLSVTKKRTNKVSTFDEDNQTWTFYYPDLLSVRSIPGVVNHLEYVIVAGGARSAAKDDNAQVVQDDIEVFNWIENSHWRKVSIKLPVSMYGFTSIVSDDHLLIVDYGSANQYRYNGVYKISVANITASGDQQHNSDTPTRWTELTTADHSYTTLVPSSSPPVVVGGQDTIGTIPTADIKMYDNSNKSWKKIGSLSSARSCAAVAAVYNNAIIIIGGYTKGDAIANVLSSSVTVVELGQAELLH